MFKLIDLARDRNLTKAFLLSQISYYQAKKGFFRKLWPGSNIKWPGVSRKMEQLIAFTQRLSTYDAVLTKNRQLELAEIIYKMKPQPITNIKLTLDVDNNSLTKQIFNSIEKLLPGVFLQTITINGGIRRRWYGKAMRTPKIDKIWSYFQISASLQGKPTPVVCIEIPKVSSETLKGVAGNLEALSVKLAELLEDIAEERFDKQKAIEMDQSINRFMAELNQTLDVISIIKNNALIEERLNPILNEVENIDLAADFEALEKAKDFLSEAKKILLQRTIHPQLGDVLVDQNIVNLVINNIECTPKTWKEAVIFLIMQGVGFSDPDPQPCSNLLSKSDIVDQAWQKFCKPFVELKTKLQAVLGLEEEKRPGSPHTVRRL